MIIIRKPYFIGFFFYEKIIYNEVIILTEFKNGRTQPSDEALARMIRYLMKTSVPIILEKQKIKGEKKIEGKRNK